MKLLNPFWILFFVLSFLFLKSETQWAQINGLHDGTVFTLDASGSNIYAVFLAACFFPLITVQHGMKQD